MASKIETGKILLETNRQAFEERVPEKIFEKQKGGFK